MNENTGKGRVRVSTAALATLTTGIVMVERFEGVGEAAEAVTGHSVWTHEMSRASERAREIIPAQLPGFPVEATSENWRFVLADAVDRFGPTVEIMRGTDKRIADPLTTLIEAREAAQARAGPHPTSGAAAAGDVAVTAPTQGDWDLANLCIPNAVIFADDPRHIQDLRRRAAEHIAKARLAVDQAARTTTTEGGMWECVVPACPVSEESADILAMLSKNGGTGEIGAAAVVGVDTIWGYADPAETEQTAQIERARGNIVVAIRAAVAGITLIAGEPPHGF